MTVTAQPTPMTVVQALNRAVRGTHDGNRFQFLGDCPCGLTVTWTAYDNRSVADPCPRWHTAGARLKKLGRAYL